MLILLLDESGEEIRERRQGGDDYENEQKRGLLPAIDVYELFDYETIPTLHPR